MRPTAALLALPLAALLCLPACSRKSSGDFSISGSVTLAPRIRLRKLRYNTILMVSASTDAGIPVAVKRYIDPKLPLRFELGEQDLLLRDPSPEERLNVRASINAHGQLGKDAPGDLVGVYGSPVSPGEKHVNIVIDRKI